MPAIGTGQLPVDEGGDAGILGAGPELVGRDQAIDDGIDDGGFVGGEEQIAAGHDRRDRIGLVRLPRQHLGDDARG